uniref:Dysbindin n=1 Tax=Oryzias sinensis TaxID=183150 RepID=A0A8C7WRM3_9TELE
MLEVVLTQQTQRHYSETDNSQRLLDKETAQHLKLKERQRFFEEVYQHDVENYLPSTHLQIDCRKPPMGSISSMEVNVDVLEQMDLMDISDQEALDVFLNSGSEEGAPASPGLGTQSNMDTLLSLSYSNFDNSLSYFRL